MSIAEEVQCLRKIPLFANIETAKLKLLAFTSDRVNFRAEDVLFSQDETGHCAYIILAGEVQVVVHTAAGPLVVATLGANEIVGEIAILCDVPRTATVRAVREVDALCVSKDLFFKMISEFPQMGVEVMRVLAHRLEQTTERLRELLSERPAI